MGANYESIAIKSEDIVRIREVLERIAKNSGCKFLVGPPMKGWISIFPKDYHQETISESITEQIHAQIFHFIVHDDGFFAYDYYRDGQLSDQYNSDPDYFEEVPTSDKNKLRGKPELFSDLLPGLERLDTLRKLLNSKETTFVFEQERMMEFARLLGMENIVGSYDYLLDGERDRIIGWKKFIHVPDEREAKRRATLELTATKKRLRDEGLLLAELLPPGRKVEAVHSHVHSCSDTLNGGFLIWWSATKTGRRPLLSFNPLEGKPPTDTGLEFDERFTFFELSPSGKWFVISCPKTQIWDWTRKQVAFEIEDSSRFQFFGFAHEERHLIAADSGKIIVNSLETGLVEHKFQIGSGGNGKAALHPGGAYLVAKNLNNLSFINLKTQKIEKTLVHMMSIVHYLPPDEYDEKMVEVIGKIGGNEESKKSEDAAERLLAESRLVGRQLTMCVPDGVTKFAFSAQGDFLFCGTHKGLRVFAWNDLISADNETPPPVFSADCPTDDPNGGYVHDFFLDTARNHIVFCGAFGKVCYLNLKSGATGILLEPPDRVSIRTMALSKEGIALCCSCEPCFEERNREVSKLQFWNYPALCRAAGLE